MPLFRRNLNKPGQHHADICVRLRNSPAALRYPDFTPTGFEVHDGMTFTNPRWQDGTVRLDYHEVLPTPDGDLVFHLGGNGYTDAQNVKYGHLAMADLLDDPGRPVPSGGGRGAPAELMTGPHSTYRVVVRSMPREMRYKRPQDTRSGSNRGALFLHYGDPAADQGDRHDIHYTYLLWSLVNVGGGGMVRTLLRDGDVFRRCDVKSIDMPSFDQAGNPNGHVRAVYGMVEPAGNQVYGWAILRHQLGDEEPVEHLELIQ